MYDRIKDESFGVKVKSDTLICSQCTVAYSGIYLEIMWRIVRYHDDQFVKQRRNVAMTLMIPEVPNLETIK